MTRMSLHGIALCLVALAPCEMTLDCYVSDGIVPSEERESWIRKG